MNSMVTVDQALQTIYLNGLSQLELLPEELIWMLLDYAPECVLKMNLVGGCVFCFWHFPIIPDYKGDFGDSVPTRKRD